MIEPLSREREAQIRELSTRGIMADGSKYPGGSILALQHLLAELDRVRAENERLTASKTQAWAAVDKASADLLEYKAERDEQVERLAKERDVLQDERNEVINENAVLRDERLRAQARPEVCICAAVRSSDGQIIRGHRHADCFLSIAKRGLKIEKTPGAQGFITSFNRYVDRAEGRRLQDAAGIPSAFIRGYMSVDLFSEDLDYSSAQARPMVACPICAEAIASGDEADIDCEKCGGSGSVPAPAEANLSDYVQRQSDWSGRTFGQGLRTMGLTRHIEKELIEIRAKPHDLSEWIDVIILALDGYWRHGGDPNDIMTQLQAKQHKNFARDWPKTTSEDEAVEHVRTEAPAEAKVEGLPEGFRIKRVFQQRSIVGVVMGPWLAELEAIPETQK